MLGTNKHLVKGLTLRERCERVCPEFAKYPNFAETDYSSFDSTFNIYVRQVEHSLLSEFLRDEEEMAYIVLVCCSEISHSEFGPEDELRRIEIPSMRYSGEPATSIGNAAGNLYLSKTCPGSNGSRFAEGDDGFLCCEERYDLESWASKHGLNIGIDWHTDPRYVKFCGRYFVGSVNSGYSSVADIRRFLDKFHLAVSSPDVCPNELLRGKCIAALALDPNTPGLSWTAYAHLTRLGAGPHVFSADDRRKLLWEKGTVKITRPVLSGDDYEYVRCQGLDPDSLRKFDQEMSDWCYGIGPKPIIDFPTSRLKTTLAFMSPIAPTSQVQSDA